MGLFDMIKKLNPESRLFGFLAGPHGVFTNNYMEITAEYMGLYRNTGGFDMIRKCQELKAIEARKTARERLRERLFRPPRTLRRSRAFLLHDASCPHMRFLAHVDAIIDSMAVGSGRHKIETPEQFASSLANANALDVGLDAVNAFLGIADADAARAHAGAVMAAVVAKGMSGRPKTVERATETCLLLCELECAEVVVAAGVAVSHKAQDRARWWSHVPVPAKRYRW